MKYFYKDLESFLGGFDPKEEARLIEIGFIPITLGNTILRVETVPMFLIGAINYEYMEW